MRDISYSDAVLEAIKEEMRRDPRVFMLCGSGFLAYMSSLADEFGGNRVLECPIAEDAAVGAAVGAACSGLRPIVNPGLISFSMNAMDQIVNQMAKAHYMFGGQAAFPMVFQSAFGGGRSAAAQHSQSPHSLFMNLAGLKIVMPATPYDAKGLMKSAIRDNNPVVFLEQQMLGRLGTQGPPGTRLPYRADVPEEEYTIPIGVADVKRPGTDVTVVAISKMVLEALEAAEELAGKGVSVEVVDPLTIVPIDKETIRASVRKTGRVVIVDEGPVTCGAASEVVAMITEDPATFRALKAPPKRVCAPDVPLPYSPIMERFCLPDKGNIIQGVEEVMAG